MGDPTVTLVSPVGKPRLERRIEVRFPTDLNDKTVVLIDNTKPKADFLLDLAAQVIAESFPGVRILKRRKPHQAAPAPFLRRP